MEGEKTQIQIPKVKLGNQGLQVSRLGFGCAGLSGSYNAPLSHEAGSLVIEDAFNKGVTFFDTSDAYGKNHDNEIMVGKALKRLPREKVQLASKFGVVTRGATTNTICGKPEYVRRELGIGIVAYSPIGSGFFGGKAVIENVPADSFLAKHPRFTGSNLDNNKVLYERVADLAVKHGCTPPQLALSWVLHQGEDVVPIPGTTKIKNLDNNIGSLKLKFTEEDLKKIMEAVPIDEVAGIRTYEHIHLLSWKFANTPSVDGNLIAHQEVDEV
ncbi:Perakine reductase [Thalictrum thalictroides]|uniref:Perakine reductase n=1 Tax=Thalictrum thalictroides TaxID=46969 RepID=A0A7J6XCP5_THATH|nr:Perakine reductase [Thalictrum thalictroides]